MIAQSRVNGRRGEVLAEQIDQVTHDGDVFVAIRRPHIVWDQISGPHDVISILSGVLQVQTFCCAVSGEK